MAMPIAPMTAPTEAKGISSQFAAPSSGISAITIQKIDTMPHSRLISPIAMLRK